MREGKNNTRSWAEESTEGGEGTKAQSGSRPVKDNPDEKSSLATGDGVSMAKELSKWDCGWSLGKEKARFLRPLQQQ